jgi:hypothetical protein
MSEEGRVARNLAMEGYRIEINYLYGENQPMKVG